MVVTADFLEAGWAVMEYVVDDPGLEHEADREVLVSGDEDMGMIRLRVLEGEMETVRRWVREIAPRRQMGRVDDGDRIREEDRIGIRDFKVLSPPYSPRIDLSDGPLQYAEPAAADAVDVGQGLRRGRAWARLRRLFT